MQSVFLGKYGTKSAHDNVKVFWGGLIEYSFAALPRNPYKIKHCSCMVYTGNKTYSYAHSIEIRKKSYGLESAKNSKRREVPHIPGMATWPSEDLHRYCQFWLLF